MNQELTVVVAHPDDEALWLGAVLPLATRIVVALPGHAVDRELEAARVRLRPLYPIGTLEYLPLRSAGVYMQSDWKRRAPIDQGVTFRPTCPPDRLAHYRSNFNEMLQLLGPYVQSGFTVCTHNPWGEYGHEEHVQVSRAVIQLAQTVGCSVWAWEGFSRRWQLANGCRLRADCFSGQEIAQLPSITMPIDLRLFRSVRELYQTHGTWTWDDLYEPPEQCTYVQLVRDGELLLSTREPPQTRELRIIGRGIARRSIRVVRRFQSLRVSTETAWSHRAISGRTLDARRSRSVGATRRIIRQADAASNFPVRSSCNRPGAGLPTSEHPS